MTVYKKLEGELKKELNKFSGGERNIFYVCLLFSLNFLNPSSFSIYDEATLFLEKRYTMLIIDLLKGLASFGNQYCLITSYFSFKASEFSGFNVICLF